MKKLMIAAVTLAAGTAALAQTASVSQPAPTTPVRPMQDHVMTRAEVVAMVREHFGRMDADKDGAVTTEEATQAHGKWGEGKAHRLGRVQHDPNAAFDRLDADKNGAISREEFAKAREERIERRIVVREQMKDGKKVGEPAKGTYRMHRMGGGMGGRMIVMADSNKDGRITLAEAEAMALQHFDQMDSNKDGQVTREERRAGRPMIHRHVIEKKTAS